MNTSEIESVYKDYLQGTTDYAILINGPWGSGKTHFWKNNLDAISKNFHMRPVYLSLNGISEISTVEQELLIRLIPFLEKNGHKRKYAPLKFIWGMMSKTVLRGGLADLFQAFSIETLDLSAYVICFDDIERCQIPISEVLGWINNLVEHKQTKIVLLAHEEKIQPEKSYHSIKEKVIGRVLNFHWNLKEAIPLLISPYNSDSGFYDLLRKRQNEITDIFSEYSITNLRTIKFFLDHLKAISKQLLAYDRTKYTGELILFSVIITIEFKEGHLNSSDWNNTKGLEDVAVLYYSIDRMRRTIEEAKLEQGEMDEIPRSYQEEFYLKYLINRFANFQFYPSLYRYILTGFFDGSLLNLELENREPQETEEKIGFKTLLTFKFRELENDEFHKLYQIVYEAAVEGKYMIYSYYQIACFFHYFSEQGIIKESKDEIDSVLLHGLEIAKRQCQINDHLFDNMQYFASEGVSADRIKREIEKIHADLKMKEITRSGNSLINSMKEGNDKAVEEFFSNNEYSDKILPYLDKAELCTAILNASNKMIFTFTERLYHRYRSSNIGEFLYEDIECLKHLSKFLKQCLRERSDLGHPKTYLLKSLESELEKHCEHLIAGKKK